MELHQKYATHPEIPIPPDSIEHWQVMLNLLAETAMIPSALIMQVHEKDIEVFVANNNNSQSPYCAGATEKLNSGLFCEWVMSNKKRLRVTNAKKDKNWDKNPDIKLGIISYLGLPLAWPTGKAFGTICILDNKENNFEGQPEKILDIFQQYITSDLDRIYQHRLLEDQNANLKSYVSIISHDLKLPLANIHSMADYILTEKNIDEEVSETFTKRINVISKDLISLSESLLNLSTKNHLEKIDICPLEDIANDAWDAITTPQDEVEFHLSELGDVQGDPGLLYEAFLNIFSNAKKFKKDNQPLVVTVKNEIEQNESNVIISICDNGVGFSSEVATDIFKAFNRGGETIAEGHGLGLATVQKIIDIHQGRVWANSDKSSGATFYIELPRQIVY